MNKIKSVMTIVFSLPVVFLLATGCSSAGVHKDANSEPKAESVKSKILHIGYQKGDPLNVLKEKGNLENRLKTLGYSVEWNQFASGPPLLEAMNAGSVDLGRTGDAPPVFAQAGGVDLVYLGTSTEKYEGSAILVKDNSPIQNVADLKGKKVAFSKGSSAHFLIVKALRASGLKYENIEPMFLAPADARVAFEKGNVDAWVIWDPYYAATQTATKVRVLTNGVGLSSDRDFYLSSRKFAANNQPVIQIFLDEVTKVSDWGKQNPHDVAQLLSPLLGIDVPSLELATKRRPFNVQPIDDKMIQGQQEIADTFYSLQLIPKQIDIKKAIIHSVK